MTRRGRHLGAIIGNKKVKNQNVTQPAQIAKDEPQLAYAAYTKVLCAGWSFVQRTMPCISQLFQPLEDVIRENFIPAVIGRKVSDIERKFLALPIRLGVLEFRIL